MTPPTPTREAILAALWAAAEPLPWIQAMYVVGSAAFGRVDEMSDVDVAFAADDGRVGDGFAVAEAVFETLGGVELAWRINPDGDVKPQRLYRLRGAGPFLLVDVGVLPVSTPPAARYTQRRRHGTPQVFFDRVGFTDDAPDDPSAHREKLRRRVAELATRFEIMSHHCVKSARRGEVAEAVVFHQAHVLRPLVELLRIRHDPWRHDFDVRYLRHDLPADVRERLARLWLVRDLDDLCAKRDEAQAWFRELLAATDVESLRL